MFIFDTAFTSALLNHMCLLHYRMPCTQAVGLSTHTQPLQEQAPIQVALKPKRRKHLQNVFLDDRGFPDQSNDYNTLLHGVDGSPILRKLKHPQPDLEALIDSMYFLHFVAAKHEAQMRKGMNLSHLDPSLQIKIYQIIQDYWSVFDEKGVFVPVNNYECITDTGSARPIAVKNILYGELEIKYMRKCIEALAKVGHIWQITDGSWLFKALLAPRPHQEHIKNIDDFVWCFCVNYIPLNGVTRVIAYPIPSVWKKLATLRGVPVGDTTNTRIIINDIVSWSSNKDYALEYIRCQLKVCQAYCLSLNLKKSHFFPTVF